MPDDPGSEIRNGGNLIAAAYQTGVLNFVQTSVARPGRQKDFDPR